MKKATQRTYTFYGNDIITLDDVIDLSLHNIDKIHPEFRGFMNDRVEPSAIKALRNSYTQGNEAERQVIRKAIHAMYSDFVNPTPPSSIPPGGPSVDPQAAEQNHFGGQAEPSSANNSSPTADAKRTKAWTDKLSDDGSSLSRRAADSGRHFRNFLARQGIVAEEAERLTELHNTFVKTELPEIDVLEAVQDLRDQWQGKKPNYARYRGRETDGDPRAHLIKHFGESIKAGRFSSGQLALADRALYDALRNDLAADPKRTVGDVFDELRQDPRRRSALVQRVDACAIVLGSSAEEAAAFFDTVRSSSKTLRRGGRTS